MEAGARLPEGVEAHHFVDVDQVEVLASLGQVGVGGGWRWDGGKGQRGLKQGSYKGREENIGVSLDRCPGAYAVLGERRLIKS